MQLSWSGHVFYLYRQSLRLYHFGLCSDKPRGFIIQFGARLVSGGRGNCIIERVNVVAELRREEAPPQLCIPRGLQSIRARCSRHAGLAHLSRAGMTVLLKAALHAFKQAPTLAYLRISAEW